MKKMILAALALTALTFSDAAAQNGKDDIRNRKEMMKEFVTKQADRLAKDMKLDDEKAADFKKLYLEYRQKAMELRHAGRGVRAQKREAGKRKKNLTDSQADSLILSNFKTEENLLQLKKEYYAKFKERLGAAKAYRLFAPERMFRGFGNQGDRRGGFNRPRPGFGGGNFGQGARGEMRGGF